jgi:phenylacetate-CoA ligase
VGRRLDVLTTPDGRRVPGEFFPHLMKEFAMVKRFQVVQDTADHVEVRVVAASQWSDCQQQAIETAAREVLGPACRLELVRVQEIPLSGSGKLKVVVNLAQAPQQTASCN